MVCLLIHWLTFLFWTNNHFFWNWPQRTCVNLQCSLLLMATQQPKCGKGLDLAEFWCIAFLNDLHWWNFAWWWCLAMWRWTHLLQLVFCEIKTPKLANYTLGPCGPYVCSWLLHHWDFCFLHGNPWLEWVVATIHVDNVRFLQVYKWLPTWYHKWRSPCWFHTSYVWVVVVNWTTKGGHFLYMNSNSQDVMDATHFFECSLISFGFCM